MYVPDEKGERVIKALENPKYDWRTIEGISRETGLGQDNVVQIMAVLSDRVIESSVPDKRGRRLFTTREHYYRKQTVANRILSAFSDRIR